eukprot:gene3092-2074_t
MFVVLRVGCHILRLGVNCEAVGSCELLLNIIVTYSVLGVLAVILLLGLDLACLSFTDTCVLFYSSVAYFCLCFERSFVLVINCSYYCVFFMCAAFWHSARALLSSKFAGMVLIASCANACRICGVGADLFELVQYCFVFRDERLLYAIFGLVFNVFWLCDFEVSNLWTIVAREFIAFMMVVRLTRDHLWCNSKLALGVSGFKLAMYEWCVNREFLIGDDVSIAGCFTHGY